MLFDSDIFGIPMIDIVTMMVALSAFMVVLAIWNAGLARDPMRGRLKSLEERREALKTGLITPQKRSETVKRVDSVGAMRSVVSKLKLLQSDQTAKIRHNLIQAGYRNKDAVVIFLFFKMVLPILLAITAVVLLFGLNLFADKPLMRVLFGPGLILLAFVGPDLFVKNTKDKRLKSIQKALPDALDLLVICAEAGLTLDAALNRVARESAQASPELGDELSLTAIELSFIQERREAIMNLAERVPLPAVRAVVTTLIQTEKYGTPLAMSLRVLSSEFRNERMMRAEEKAARLPATMTVPLILFILPVLFVVLLGPATCRVADNFINR